MKNRAITLRVSEMVYGGNAFGKHDGQAVFVPYAIAGEQVEAAIVQDKGRYAVAQLELVVEPSPERVVPRCPFFGPGRCGGCHWQHIDYPAQLRFKAQIVRDQLTRFGGFDNVTVYPTLPSPDPWQYRSHITFHVAPDGRLGFVATDDRTVIPVDECHIIRPELLAMLREAPPVETSDIRRVRMQVGSDSGETTVAAGTSERDLRRVAGLHAVQYAIKERQFRVSPGGFFQVNLAGAEMLVDLVLDRLALTGAERVLDLYAGVGLFTAFAAERAAHVTAVESHAPSVVDARDNLADFDNVLVVEGRVEDALDHLRGHFEQVIVDPPRSGLGAPVIDRLLLRPPRQLVYVACDPAALARDGKRLAASGYRLVDAQPVDLFPQTHHIETVANFVLDNP